MHFVQGFEASEHPGVSGRPRQAGGLRPGEDLRLQLPADHGGE